MQDCPHHDITEKKNPDKHRITAKRSGETLTLQYYFSEFRYEKSFKMA